MEPGVPFALLGSVQLLAVAGWAGLAAAALALSRTGRGRAALLAAGALLLAAVETRTALRFGEPRSDLMDVVRAAGLLLVGAGCLLGGLGARRDIPFPTTPSGLAGATGAGAAGAAGAAGVVIPLGAGPGAATVAAVAGFFAAGACLRARRDYAGGLVAGALVLTGAAAALGAGAATSPHLAMAVLIARAGADVALLAGLVALASASLLSKVVAAILAGVLVMAGAAVGVVGTVVVRAYDRQAASLVEQAAQGRQQALDSVGDRAAAASPLLAEICGVQPTAICNQVLTTVAPRVRDFVVEVARSGASRSLGGRAPLSAAERLGLAGPGGPVQAVLHGSGAGAVTAPLPAKILLSGAVPAVAVVAVTVRRADRPAPQARPTRVVVYGVRIDDDYTSQDFDAGGYGLSFLAGDPLGVVASNLSDRERQRVAAVAARYRVGQGLAAGGLTVPAEGSHPTVRFAPLLGVGDVPVAVLALSRDAGASLATERDALRVLLETALVTTAIVGGFALLLGRRTVEPVRRLTAAAQRVSAGDLSATAGVTTLDEVGTLSRTFDAMTSSLARLTGDLRSSATRLQTVLASMSDGLVAVDDRGRVTSMNPAALAMVGLAREGDGLGRPLSDVVELRDAAGVRLGDVGRLPQGSPGQVLRPDGAATPVRIAVTPLETGDGLLIVLRDTTREREVERMKTEFLSNVSHELRTPLTPIRGYADLLVARPGLAPKQVGTFARTIRDESLRMSRVVDLLVDVAALEAGRVTVTPRAVSVRDLVDGRLAAWRGRSPARAQDLRRKVSTGLPMVLVDPMWVGKALDELLDNAVKHTPVGTSITLAATVSPEPGRVRLSVRDTGPGIPVEDQGTLFSSFEQVDGSATRRVGGLGLGLSFVRRLADDAGFPLTVSSTVGRGTEFSLDLPAADAPAVGRASRRRATPPASPAARKRGRGPDRGR